MTPEEQPAVTQAVPPALPAAANGKAVPLHEPAREPMHRRQRTAIGWGIILFASLLFTQLVAVWPATIAATTANAAVPKTTLLFGVGHVAFGSEAALIVMVAIVATLASLVELIRSFTTHSGRGDLSRRWMWWYALRPIQGTALALVAYFALRGGLLGADSTKPLNPYGVAAIAGLVGLFTRHAVKKLSDVFDAIFGEPGEDANIRPKDG